ncbi:uncharacterized protein BXZ73DRAFT_97565 [Epithele typhae]|uniref:uncharacterized protein n=1 Tax=Epithele typhae TaxID=378194 RepID=UPI0020074384|nr:uncharacterized protein BXZ73DRAFT_97565 [Epithele typhae]KAH9942140.1 hypothetical protein BXZ73DRAFT_97565 [Epithele typhae]
MPDSDNGITSIINETTSQRTLAPVAVASQVGLMLGISFATVILFNLLRPRNKIIYEPKVKYHVGDKVPPRASDSFLGWVSPLIHTKEAELVDKIGLDAAIYLRFIRLCRWLFTAITFVCCAVLIPINVTYNLAHVKSKNRDALSMLTIRDVSGNLLFAHVAVTYVITFLVIGFVYVHWREVVRLRRSWFRSPEYVQSFYARTLIVNNVPKKLQSDEGIRAIFESVHVPYPTTSVHVGHKIGRLPELIEYHNDAVRELEAVLVTYLKGGKIAKKRPTITIGGWLCFGGEKKDAIDYYTAKLQRADKAVQEFRNQIDLRKPENYGFASMAAVPYAHIVANMLKRKSPKGAAVSLAPNPKDIVWKNLGRTQAEIRRAQTMGWLWLIAICAFNTIPLLIISVLANLASITAYVPFLQSWSDASPGSFTFVSGVLPSTVSALFGWALPIIMRKLTKFMGAYTHSRMDRAVVARYFAFLIISQLIIFTLIGVIFNAVKQVVLLIGKHASVDEIFHNFDTSGDHQPDLHRPVVLLAHVLPASWFLVIFDLAQLLNLFIVSFKTHFLGRTPREIREWTQPPEFQFAVYYSNMLFMASVGSVVYKYQLMFVFVSKTESGGRMWNVVINRLLAGVILMQCIMVLTIGLQYTFKSFYWIATVPPIFFIIIFKGYINRVFQPSFRYYMPTEEELRDAEVHSQRNDNARNRLEKRFGHPSLHSELFTPMVHANMTHLLSQVYHGKLGTETAKVGDMGGRKMDTTVVAGGIKIAGVQENDLAYDPAMYRRDRGDDWDTRSIASSNMLSDKAPYPEGGRSSPAPSKFAGYDRYLAQGPTSEIEMTRLDIPDNQPLLNQQGHFVGQGQSYYDPMAASQSNVDLNYATPLSENPHMPLLPAAYAPDVAREASLHRPYPSGGQYTPPQQPWAPGPGAYIQRTGSPAQVYSPHHQQEDSGDYFSGNPAASHVASQRSSPDSYRSGVPARTPPPGLYDGPQNMAGRGAHRAPPQ